MFPTDLASFIALIRQHGDLAYGLMFAFASWHSLLQTLFAGYVVHAGALEFGKLIAICWLGSFAGDAVRMWVGRMFGTGWLAAWPRLATTAEVIVRLAERHHVWMILLHRYPHGIRSVAAFAYGMSNVHWGTFLVLNFIAAGIWSVVVVSAGYAFGHLSEKVMQDASSGLGAVMLFTFLGLSWVLSKKLERAVEKG